MKKIAIREAKRNNVSYRPFSIEALGEFAVALKGLDLTLEIVPYLTELIEELTDEDAMDVDEADGKPLKNREQTIVEETVSAIVSCLFKVLSAHTSEEALDSATKIVEKAQANRSNALDIALYDSAKYFVSKSPKRHMADDVGEEAKAESDKITSPASNGALATQQRSSADDASAEGIDPGVFERFQPLIMAVLAFPLEPWRQPERGRRSRVDLALALAQRGPQNPAALAAILDPWVPEERSRPLREDIERARQACRRALSQ